MARLVITARGQTTSNHRKDPETGLPTVEILVDIVFPVFGLALLGFFATRMGWFDQAGARGLSGFVFNFAIPVMLFRTISQATLPDQIPWTFFISYYLSAGILFGLAAFMGRLLFCLPATDLGIFGMAASYSNVVLMGIPLIITAYGEAALIPLFLIISTHAAVMFMTTTATMEASRKDTAHILALPWLTLKVLARNVIVLGLVAGLCFNLLDLSMPRSIDSIAKSLSGAALPCAVFSMGVSLGQYRIRGGIAQAFTLIGLKNLVHPLLVWSLAGPLFNLPPLWIKVAVILAACPIGINTYLFAQRYNALIPTTAAAVVLSTGLSFFTISFILLLLGP
jgi:malonate transporter